MSRIIRVAAAQLGPIQACDNRTDVVERLLGLLREAHGSGCDLVVFPEMALTTFFPRWYFEDIHEADRWYEKEMPSEETQPLFEEARSLGIGFSLGYAELTLDSRRFNTQIIVDKSGEIVGKYRKVHLPGHREYQPDRDFQHAERYYFEPGEQGFDVYNAFGGTVGMMICNDRRWPESYRIMGLLGVELIVCGYNTPINFFQNIEQNKLAGFHNTLVMQSGAYQNCTFVVGVAKGGDEEGVESLSESCIIAPSGEILAKALTRDDELVIAECDLDWCTLYRSTVFDFDLYRRPELYGSISSPKDALD